MFAINGACMHNTIHGMCLSLEDNASAEEGLKIEPHLALLFGYKGVIKQAGCFKLTISTYMPKVWLITE